MKKVLLAAVFLAGFSFSYAQESKAKSIDPKEDKDLMTWYHKDFSGTKVYGVNTENAYKYLESKGLKPKTVVVGVLDSGVQVDHPGLIKNVWSNLMKYLEMVKMMMETDTLMMYTDGTSSEGKRRYRYR